MASVICQSCPALAHSRAGMAATVAVVAAISIVPKITRRSRMGGRLPRQGGCMPESDLKARVLKLATGADPEPQQTPAELAALARADAAEKAHATAVATITRLEADLARERQSTEQRIKDANVAAAALTETLRADLATTRTELATARAECTRHQDCAMESERRAVDALRDVARLTGDLATEKARKVVPPVVVPTEPAAPSVISLDGMEIEVLSRDRNNNIERCRMVTQ